jgi:hypothetical protein
VSIQSSVYGGPIPIVYGQTRLTGNLIWYGDFKAIAPTSNQSSGGKGLGGSSGGGKNGGGSSSTDYKASFAFALGEGPFSAIETVWASKTETAFGASGLGFESGAAGQTPWGYLTTYHPGQNLSYQGTAYVTAQACDLGDSAQMPNLSFEATGQGANAIAGQPDADPAFVVSDFLTSSAYGAGFPAARIGDLSVYSNYCRAAGLVISPLFDTQQDAATTLNDIVQQTNAEFVWSGGQLTVVPYGDMALAANGAVYAPPTEALYSLTDDDFLDDGGAGDPVQLVRARPSDRMNSIKLEWLNRANQYNPEIVEAKDQAAIEIYGLRSNQSQQSHYFCNLAAATMSATLQLQRQAVRNQYSFTLGWKYCLLDPMDIVEITDANLGLNQQWVRILSIEEDDNGNLKITAEEYLGGAGGAPLYSYQTGSPFIANYNIAPGPLNEPVIFEPSGALTAGVPQVWVGASGGANWGGADVWLSIDNATYSRVGRIAGPARQGILHAPLALGGDPDTAHTLSVDLSESGAALLSGTQADADAFRTLCYVANDSGNGGELISYETASLTGGNLYGLTYLRRGLFGTVASAHSAGAQFCRLDDAILKIDLPIAPVSYVGQTIYLKLTGYNAYGGGQQALADVPAYSYNPAGTGAYVAPPSGVAISVGTQRQPDGTIVPFMEISWTASPDPLFDEYEVQWRLHTGPGAWQSQKLGPNVTSFTVIPVQPLTAFDAQVRAIRNQGGPFFSAWAQQLNVSTIFKTAPPPAPTGLSVVGGYRQITVDWTASAENDIAWYEVWESADATLAHATRIGLINGTHYVRPGLNLNDTRSYWIRAEDTSGNYSAYLGPGSSTTLPIDSSDVIGAIVATEIADNSIAASKLVNGLNAVQVVATIALASHTISNIVYATDTGQLYQWNGSAFVIPAVSVTPGSITLADFATGVTPVQIVSSLPGSGTEGQIVVLTVDGQLYRYHSGSWTVAVPAANVTGLLTASQIASITAAQISTQLTASQIASISTAQLTGQIATTQITNGAVTTPLLAAGAVNTAALAANAVTAGNIAAGAVVAGTIGAGAFNTAALAAGAVTAYNIAAYTITGTQIASNTITSAQIAAGTITASNIAANTITAGQIAAGTITASNIAANTITAGQIAAGSITAAQIATGTITAAQVAAGTITAAQIQAGGITGDRIAGNTITASNLAANSVTAASILAGTITGDKISGNFFQGYNFTASAGSTGGYLQMYGGQYTNAYGLQGPYFAAVDNTGACRVQMGMQSGAWGLWVYDSAGNPIFEESALGTNVVSTGNVRAGNIVAQGFATVPFGVYAGGTSWQLIAQFSITLYDNANVMVFGNILHGIAGPGFGAAQIQADGAPLGGADISESTGTLSGGIYLSGNPAGVSHTISFYWSGSNANYSVNGGSLIAFAGQR